MTSRLKLDTSETVTVTQIREVYERDSPQQLLKPLAKMSWIAKGNEDFSDISTKFTFAIFRVNSCRD